MLNTKNLLNRYYRTQKTKPLIKRKKVQFNEKCI
jgi:hypothetical protein